MEPILPNQDDDSEMMRRLREMEGMPPEEKGLSKQRKVLIVAAWLGGLMLLALILFLMSGKQPGKQGKAIPAINRGLMQAETIRTQKDQLDEKNRMRSEAEEWMKKVQAAREAAKEDTAPFMPDPVPMYSQGKTPSHELPEVRPTHGQDFPGTSWKAPLPFGNNASGSGPPPLDKPVEFRPDTRLAERMSDEYMKALAYNASEQLVFTRDRLADVVDRMKAPGAPVQGGQASMSKRVVISAGQELTAVLNESMDSDYPSVAKATMTSPPELSGAILLLSYGLGQERVSAQVLKLILPAKEGERAREQNLAAVVKSGLPGLTGDVSHHWIPQIASGLVSAGLTAGALAYAAQNGSKDLGTAVLVAPMVEQSVQGVLKPVNYLGRDRPVTVKVPAGTEFTLLVTEGFEVDL